MEEQSKTPEEVTITKEQIISKLKQKKEYYTTFLPSLRAEAEFHRLTTEIAKNQLEYKIVLMKGAELEAQMKQSEKEAKENNSKAKVEKTKSSKDANK